MSIDIVETPKEKLSIQDLSITFVVRKETRDYTFSRIRFSLIIQTTCVCPDKVTALLGNIATIDELLNHATILVKLYNDS